MLTPISPLLRRTLALTSLACTAFITLGTAVSAHAEPVKGEVIKTVPESQIVETLIEEAMRLAEQQRGSEDDAAGSPVVTVS